MWIPKSMVDEVDKVAVIFKLDWQFTNRWNKNRKPNELRLMGGWVWAAKSGNSEQTGFQSKTAAYINAWCRLVANIEPPRINRPVARKRASG